MDDAIHLQIDRELMQMTNERLVYGGVTTDLVSMRDQPLHAMPMFKVSPIDHRLAASLKTSRDGNMSVIAKFRKHY